MLDALGIGVAGGLIAIVIAGVAGWAWRQQRPSRLEKHVADVRRALEELKEGVLAPPPGASTADTEALAAEATPDTERLLAEAIALQRQHKEREAIECLLEAYRRDLPPLAKAQLHVLAGNGLFRLSELAQAEDHYQQALSAAREAGERPAEAAALGNLGNVYADRGELERAEEHYRTALALNEEFGDSRGRSAELNNLGVIYAQMGDLEKARGYFLEALALKEKIGDKLGQADHLASLGIVHYRQGELAKAEEHHRRALLLHEQAGDKLGQAGPVRQLGQRVQTPRGIESGTGILPARAIAARGAWQQVGPGTGSLQPWPARRKAR